MKDKEFNRIFSEPARLVERDSEIDKAASKPARSVNSDSDIYDDVENIKTRNGLYTNLLATYFQNISETFNKKRRQKAVFFWLSIVLLLVPMAALAVIIYAYLRSGIDMTNTNVIVALVSVVIAFISTVIVIPNTIASYLFNAKEEDALSQVLSNIKDYDISLRHKKPEKEDSSPKK